MRAYNLPKDAVKGRGRAVSKVSPVAQEQQINGTPGLVPFPLGLSQVLGGGGWCGHMRRGGRESILPVSDAAGEPGCHGNEALPSRSASIRTGLDEPRC